MEFWDVLKPIRYTALLAIWILAATHSLRADVGPAGSNQAEFVSVNGDVKVMPAYGKKEVPAEEEMVVREGARIITKDESSAVLRLFDGSELTVAPRTEFELTKLQKPSGRDKVLKFDLFIGKLTAVVKALLTSKSAFEIEAGGVVCGVRGTEFSLETDPALGQALLIVNKGIVATDQKGYPSHLIRAGEHLVLNHLHFSAPEGTTMEHLLNDVGAPTAAGSPQTAGSLNNPALQTMVKNAQMINLTNKTNLIKTIQQGSNISLHVGASENTP